MSYFSEEEIKKIEKLFSDGITSNQIIDIFSQRGAKLSEPTFRKYVQLGLLPRSIRVGRKGKYQGSRGLYPVSVVRRINDIKKLMEMNYTIEQIKDQFGLQQGVDWEEFEKEIEGVIVTLQKKIDEIGGKNNKNEQLKESLKLLKSEFSFLIGRLRQVEKSIITLQKEKEQKGENQKIVNLLR